MTEDRYDESGRRLLPVRERVARWAHSLASRIAPGVTWGEDPALVLDGVRGERRGMWIGTFGGRKFWPLDARAEEVSVVDVAHALSMIARYGGHARYRYSVAEHSVLVSHHVPPEFAREALMHDAAEAYLGDVVRPLKRDPVMAGYRDAEASLERAIAERFELRTDPAARAAVKEIDDRILVDEIRHLMTDPDLYFHERSWLRGLSAIGVEIECWSPTLARQKFLARFAELFPERLG